VTSPLSFAWCFSHGRMHFFAEDQEPWCTATWVPLAAGSEDKALAEKQRRYGDAQFLDQLPLEQQVAIINQQETP